GCGDAAGRARRLKKLLFSAQNRSPRLSHIAFPDPFRFNGPIIHSMGALMSTHLRVLAAGIVIATASASAQLISPPLPSPSLAPVGDAAVISAPPPAVALPPAPDLNLVPPPPPPAPACPLPAAPPT